MTIRILAVLGLFVAPLAAMAQPRLDGHRFPLPEGAIARIGNLRFVSPEWINAVAISGDGKCVACGSRSIFLWDLKSGRVVREIKNTELLSSLAFSHNGRLLASMDQQASFTVRNTATGEHHGLKSVLTPESRHPVTDMRFAGDDLLVAITFDDAGRVELWDSENGMCTRVWEMDDAKKRKLSALGKGSAFVSVSLSPSGDLMAWLASSHRTDKDGRSDVYLYETVSGKLLREVKGLRAADRVQLIDEGKTIVLDPCWTRESADRATMSKFAVIDLADGKTRVSCDYRTRPVSAGGSLMPFSKPRTLNVRSAFQDGKSLITIDGLGMIRWDLSSGKKQNEWTGGIPYFNISKDGKQSLVGRGRRIQIMYDGFAALGNVQDPYEAPAVLFQPDGQMIVQPRWGVGHVNVWDLRKMKVTSCYRLHETPWTGRTPCDHDFYGKLFAHHVEDGIAVHDLLNNRRACVLENTKVSNAWNIFPRISKDRKRVLVCQKEEDGLSVRWCEPDTGKELGRCRISGQNAFPGHFWPVNWYSDDGTLFGYVTLDSRLALVDCTAGEVRKIIGSAVPMSREEAKAKKGWPVWEYELSHGFILATKTKEVPPGQCDYELWDQRTGRLVRRFGLRLEGLKENGTWSATLSPNNRFVVVRDSGRPKELFIHETVSGQCRGKISAPSDIHSLAFALDSKTLVTSCEDTTVLLWDFDRPLSAQRPLPLPTSGAETEKLFQALGNPNADAMEPALWALVRAPEHALPLLKEKLQPVHGPGAGQLETLIARLGSADFK